jgi:hypothetical protein
VAETFYLGDVVVLDAPFTVNGVPTNPATATCTIKQPDGTLTTPSTTNPVTGTIHVEFTPDQSGTHAVRIVGTGTAAGAYETEFHVRRSLVLP